MPPACPLRPGAGRRSAARARQRARPPAASETVTPTAPSGGICARTDQVRDAIVARIGAARDCTQVTAAHLASLRGKLKLAGKGISSLKAGDFAVYRS